MNDLPSGVVVAFAGTQDKIPNGWHECDGTTLDRNQNQSLFNAIGTKYGGDGNPSFKLPDYRGYFLRAANSRSPNDPSAGPDAGRSVGSTQTDAIQQHTHTVPGVHLQAQGGSGFDGSGFDSNSSRGGWQGPYSSNGVASANVSTETRPINFAVLYLIKL